MIFFHVKGSLDVYYDFLFDPKIIEMCISDNQWYF